MDEARNAMAMESAEGPRVADRTVVGIAGASAERTRSAIAIRKEERKRCRSKRFGRSNRSKLMMQQRSRRKSRRRQRTRWSKRGARKS